MSGMDLAAIMDAIAANLETITGLRVFAYTPETVAPPAAIVGYPERITYDLTYQRGADRATFPIWIVVGLLYTKGARDELSTYLSAGAVGEIKAALDGRLPVDDTPTVQVANVVDAAPDVIRFNNTPFLAAKLQLDVIA
jgi:hypothetical protein